MRLKIDRWDSDFFGVRIARLEISREYSDFSEYLTRLLEQAKKDSALFIVIKLLEPGWIYEKVLVGQGFKKCGESADMKYTLSSVYKRPLFKTHVVRLAKSKDMPAVSAIAKDAFRLSYLYKCGFSQRSKVDHYHSMWAENLMKDKAVKFFVAEKGGRVIGFIGMRLNMHKRQGRIVLVAVDRRFRGIGTGSALVKKCISYGKDKLTTIFIKTQAENKKALLLYKRMGFVVAAYDKVFCKKSIGMTRE